MQRIIVIALLVVVLAGGDAVVRHVVVLPHMAADHVGHREEEVPAGLRRALAVGNRMQDLLTKEFVSGRRGNQILAVGEEQADASRGTRPLPAMSLGACTCCRG